MRRIFLWHESRRLSLGDISYTEALVVEAGLCPDMNKDRNTPEVSILILTDFFFLNKSLCITNIRDG